MGFVFNIIFTIVGYAISAVGMAQILTILLFAIPFTREISMVTIVNKSQISKKIMMTLCIWTIIILIMFALTFIFTQRVVALCIGFIAGILSVLKYCGKTESNVQEYFATYSQYIDMRFLEDFENFCDGHNVHISGNDF